MRDELHDSDAAFERWLLDAARGEEPPAALTEQAWARFAAASGRMAGAVSGHAGASWLGLHVSRASLGWLALGLVAGSALTLALVPSRQALPVHSTEEQSAGTGDLAPPHLPAGRATKGKAATAEVTNVVAEATSAVAEAAKATEATEATSAEATSAEATSAEAATAEVTNATASNVRRARPRPRVRPRPVSTLAAEIEALDTVRAAIAAGHPVEALEGVAAFHRRFPRAQLGADAEGLAIEALLAQGAREEAADRAKGFIRDYPRDPHVPRFAPIAEQ